MEISFFFPAVMASLRSSLSVPTKISALLSHPVAEKISRENFALWQAQVLPTIRSTQLLGILEGKVPALAETVEIEDPADKAKTKESTDLDYVAWLAQDQLLLGYLTNLMSREVLMQVVRCSSSTKV